MGNFKLQHFQEQAVIAINDYYKKISNYKSTKWLLVSSPTSTGKTYIGLLGLNRILEEDRSGKITAIFCTNSTLCKIQIEEKKRELYDQYKGKFLDIRVHTIQYLYLNSELFGSNKIIMCFDEAHHLREDKEWQKFLREKVSYLFGMTGTPRISWEEDGFEEVHRIDRADTNLKFPKIKSELVEFDRDYVVENLKRSKDFLEINDSDEGLKRLKKDYQTTGYLERYLANEILKKKEMCGQALIICNSCPLAHKLESLINNENDIALVIDGKTPIDARRNIIKLFKNETIQFLIGVDVLSEGFDVPNIKSIFLFDQTNSDIRYSQIVGRGLRPEEGKNSISIFDYRDNVKRFHHQVSDADYLFAGSEQRLGPVQPEIGLIRNQIEELSHYSTGKIQHTMSNLPIRDLNCVISALMGVDAPHISFPMNTKSLDHVVYSEEVVEDFLKNIHMVLKKHLAYFNEVEISRETKLRLLDNIQTLDEKDKNINGTNREVDLVRYLVEPLMQHAYDIRNLKREYVLSNNLRIDLYFSTTDEIHVYEFAIGTADKKLDQIKNYRDILKKHNLQTSSLENKKVFKLHIIGTSFQQNSKSRPIEDGIDFINWATLFFDFLLKSRNHVKDSGQQFTETFDVLDEYDKAYLFENVENVTNLTTARNNFSNYCDNSDLIQEEVHQKNGAPAIPKLKAA